MRVTMDDLTARASSDDDTTETEWVVRWPGDGIVSYRTRGEAVNIARIYGYGTPESKVSVQHRTITTTHSPWITEPDEASHG
jgi:hypothetical protein